MSKKLKICLFVLFICLVILSSVLLLLSKKKDYKDYNIDMDVNQQEAINNSSFISQTDSSDEIPKEIKDMIIDIKEDSQYSTNGVIVDVVYDEEENKTFYYVEYNNHLWYIYRLMDTGIIYAYPDPRNSMEGQSEE